MNKKLLLIGIGNPIRGDDGLGFHAAAHFEEYPPVENLESIHVQQLTMDLVPLISSTDFVLFVDARIGEPFGKIYYDEIQPNAINNNPVSHFFDPQTLMAVIHGLYQKHPKAGLISVNTDEFDFTEELSTRMQTIFPDFLDRIREILEKESQ